MSSCSMKHKLLLVSLLAFIVLSEASRFPEGSWEQMLPKKLPTPSSAPSKGTNSVPAAHSTFVESEKRLPSSDGNV